jgi:hypothetical protein
VSLPFGSFQRPTIEGAALSAPGAGVLGGAAGAAGFAGGDGGREGGGGGGGVEEPKPKNFFMA